MPKVSEKKNGRKEVTSYQVTLSKKIVEKLQLQNQEVELIEHKDGILIKRKS